MRQKFNVQLINKMAHSVCLLVESVCGDIIKNTDITDNSLSHSHSLALSVSYILSGTRVIDKFMCLILP